MTITLEHFATICRYVLEHGDRQTYCNMYNQNPHANFGAFDVYLNPEGGQRNINCDPEVGGFDHIVIREFGREPKQYFDVRLFASELVYEPGDEAAIAEYFGQILGAISGSKP